MVHPRLLHPEGEPALPDEGDRHPRNIARHRRRCGAKSGEPNQSVGNDDIDKRR